MKIQKPSQGKINKILSTITKVLNKYNIPYLIYGSFAFRIYSKEEDTEINDIDIIIKQADFDNIQRIFKKEQLPYRLYISEFAIHANHLEELGNNNNHFDISFDSYEHYFRQLKIDINNYNNFQLSDDIFIHLIKIDDLINIYKIGANEISSEKFEKYQKKLSNLKSIKTMNQKPELKKFNIANTFAYGHVKRLVKAEEIALFKINSSIEMHLLRHFSEVSEDYKKSLLTKNYHYFDHSKKKFEEGVVTQEDIQNALTTKGTKFNKFIKGIENPRKLLKWLKSNTVKLFNSNELYTIEKGLESKIYLQFDYPEIVGAIDIVEYNELSYEERTKVREVNRSAGHDQATKINIIKGKVKKPTNTIAFLLHKVPELNFFFGSAFPGNLNPEFPDEQSDKDYWDNIVFIE